MEPLSRKQSSKRNPCKPKRKFGFPWQEIVSSVFVASGDCCVVKMATPRRSSQQQQPSSLLSSPPRGSSVPVTPPGSPPASTDDASPLSHGAAMENAADGEATPASPTSTSPALALNASTSSSSSSTTSSSASSPTTTEGSGTSPGSTPDSGSGNPGSSSGSGGGGNGGGANGAFRELFEACRNGDVSRVKKLVDAVNVNAKDMAGRKSTPLHFAAGNHNKNNILNKLQSLFQTVCTAGELRSGGGSDEKEANKHCSQAEKSYQLYGLPQVFRMIQAGKNQNNRSEIHQYL